MHDRPRISVVMPVFNGGSLVDEAIASVLAQTFADFELIVVDDGSTDETPARLRRWAAVDHRVRVETQEANAGQTRALVRGCARAQGEFIAILDSDDRARPDRLEREVAVLEARPELAAVGSGYELMDEDGVVFSQHVDDADSAELASRLEQGRNILVHSTWLVRRAAYERAGGYRAPFALAEDFDLMLRLAEVGSIAVVPLALVQYRFWGEQLTSKRTGSMARAAALAVALSRRRRLEGREPIPVDTLASVDQGLSTLGVPAGDVAVEDVHLRLWLAAMHVEAHHGASAVGQLGRALIAATRATGGRALAAKVVRTGVRLARRYLVVRTGRSRPRGR